MVIIGSLFAWYIRPLIIANLTYFFVKFFVDSFVVFYQFYLFIYYVDIILSYLALLIIGVSARSQRLMASLNTPVQPNIWIEIAVFHPKLAFYW
jgi:hypothetical protein